MKAELPGFGAVIQENVRINVGATTELAMELLPQIGEALLVTAEPVVIRKKEDRREAANHGRSKPCNQRWIDFLRSTGLSGVQEVEVAIERSRLKPNSKFRLERPPVDEACGDQHVTAAVKSL